MDKKAILRQLLNPIEDESVWNSIADLFRGNYELRAAFIDRVLYLMPEKSSYLDLESHEEYDYALDLFEWYYEGQHTNFEVWCGTYMPAEPKIETQAALLTWAIRWLLQH